jgi:26S proteasome regulatory subunit N1
MPPEHPNPAAPSEHSQPPPPAAVKGKEKLKKKEADDLVCPLTKGSLIFFNFFFASIRSHVSACSVAQSEEDLLLKEQLELYVLRAQDSDPGVQKLALESMRYT